MLLMGIQLCVHLVLSLLLLSVPSSSVAACSFVHPTFYSPFGSTVQTSTTTTLTKLNSIFKIRVSPTGTKPIVKGNYTGSTSTISISSNDIVAYSRAGYWSINSSVYVPLKPVYTVDVG